MYSLYRRFRVINVCGVKYPKTQLGKLKVKYVVFVLTDKI